MRKTIFGAFLGTCPYGTCVSRVCAGLLWLLQANPLAMILSAAMMLRYDLGREVEADLIEQAVDNVMDAG